MKKEKEKNLRLSEKAIALMAFVAFMLFISWAWARASASSLENKVNKEAKNANKLKKLLKEKGHLLFQEPVKAQAKQQEQDLSTLVEDIVVEGRLEGWMVRLQPIQAAGEGDSVRIVFQSILFEGIIRFFSLLRKRNLSYVEENQVSIALMGKGEDRWRATIVLKKRLPGKKK